MVKKSSGWNLQEMQDTLVKDTEQKITDGFGQIADGGTDTLSNKGADEDSNRKGSDASIEPVMVEPTKGVQTSIPMSVYQRLYDQKIRRDRENMKAGVKVKATLGALVIEAVRTWLDVQEGKAVVLYQQDGQSSESGSAAVRTN